MSPLSLGRYLRVATRAAIEAGALLAKHVGKPAFVKTKRSAIDLVTNIDRAAESRIHRILMKANPDFDFLGEEQGQRSQGSAYRWIVDPLDGTSNFVHGFPMFGVSIALQYQTRMLVGVIYDPMRKELFTATKGGGAFLNGKRLHVSPVRQLSCSLLSTGFSFYFRQKTQPYLKWFIAFQRHSHGVRRIGSTVISLASIASGRMEGFYEQELWPWDVAAGMLLVEEAGGRTSGFDGRRAVVESGRLVASNSHIHSQMLALLR